MGGKTLIKIYGKASGCSNCVIAKERLEKYGIDFKFIDVIENKQALEFIKSLGYRQVPVIENEGDFYTIKTLDDLIIKLSN